MDPWNSFSEFQNEAFSCLVATTKTTAALASEDLAFHRSLDPTFASSLDRCNKQMINLASSLLRSCAATKDVELGTLADVDGIETYWRDIIEVIDSLLEKADTCLDEYTGAIKQKNPEPIGSSARNDVSKARKKPRVREMFRNRNIPKPQLQFKTKVENYDMTPFKPILTSKPHAVVPLEDSISTVTNHYGQTQYYHPYQAEIEQLKYPSEVYESRSPIKYRPFESTTAITVHSNDALLAMFDELKRAREIAIDLEHHSERSYVGFVCLMQISTREKDWIIDTLKLREELQILNEIFADPNIIKVLHGAYMDIVWLQRDLGLYIVGLFDTYEAAKVLGFSGRGLAFLLKKYVDFDAEKQYQLADWRIRPLPQEMLDYARSDTHFLLYCYDRVRNELVERTDPSSQENSLIEQVLLGSKKTSLLRYEREAYDAKSGTGQNGWALTLAKTPVMYSPEQLAVFKALHEWRDTVARAEDESLHYVMQKHQLFNLARLMPENASGVLGACHPASPCVRLRVHDIIAIICETRQVARQEAIPEEPQITRHGINNNASDTPENPATVLPSRLTTVKNDLFSFDDIPQQSQLRGIASNFWGGTLGSTKWSSATDRSTLAEIRLAVPLPPLTASIFINPNDEKPSAEPSRIDEPGSQAEHEFVRTTWKPQEENIFVVKQVGGRITKRKREGEGRAEESLLKKENASDEKTSASIASDNTNPQPSEIEKKKKRKKEKRPTATASTASSSFQPFDYTNAPSILNRPVTEGDIRYTFNPYSNSLEGPKRIREGKRGREGKSLTFRR